MIRELFLDEAPDYCRAAIVEDGKLCEIHMEKRASVSQEESLYYGRVVSIRKSMHAAFVDIGDELNAFLPLDEHLHIRCGDMLIVQGAAKQSSDNKGLRITAKVNLAGKWIVLIPGESGIHISKKIKGESLRSALLELGRCICPADCALIIRTAGEGVTQELLQEEASLLYARWQTICQRALGMTKPGLLYQRESLGNRMIRDVHDLSRIVTNSHESYLRMLSMKEDRQLLQAAAKIEWFEESAQLLFDAFSIESQIDKALHKRVWLPCGGYLIIDFCEAMTVIDVNSGKMVLGKDLEDTALQVNLEAAAEIARQIRLRDMGGIIVVDFIDMLDPKHKQELLFQMKKAVSRDRTQVVVEEITKLGLMEITRKRVHAPLRKSMQANCSYCSSTGLLLSADEVARRAMRQIRRMLIAGQRGPFLVRCSAAVVQALSLMNMSSYPCRIYAQAVNRHAERFEIEQISLDAALPKDAVTFLSCI